MASKLEAWLEFHDIAEPELQRRFPDYHIRVLLGGSLAARITDENGIYADEVTIECSKWRDSTGVYDFVTHGDDMIERLDAMLRILTGITADTGAGSERRDG